MSVFRILKTFIKTYPVTKGMLSYAVIWPLSSLMQQTVSQVNHYNYLTPLRFGIYGSLVVGPTMHYWIKMSSYLIPGNGLKIAITKAVVEQIIFTPPALVCFFFGIALLEGRGLKGGADEVEVKFLPAYLVGLCYWPIVQTFNFGYVKEHNRVIVACSASFFWTCFLAFIHQRRSGLEKNQ